MCVIDGKEFHNFPDGDIMSLKHGCPPEYHMHPNIRYRFVPNVPPEPEPTQRKRGGCRGCRSNRL